jgi:hypothetical protein
VQDAGRSTATATSIGRDEWRDPRGRRRHRPAGSDRVSVSRGHEAPQDRPGSPGGRIIVLGVKIGGRGLGWVVFAAAIVAEPVALGVRVADGGRSGCPGALRRGRQHPSERAGGICASWRCRACGASISQSSPGTARAGMLSLTYGSRPSSLSSSRNSGMLIIG